MFSAAVDGLADRRILVGDHAAVLGDETADESGIWVVSLSPDFSPGGGGTAYSVEEIERVLSRQNTACFVKMPIPALAGSRAPGLALHSSGSYGYHFPSSAASGHTSPAPVSGIPVRNPG